jgi:hypothetical protein
MSGWLSAHSTAFGGPAPPLCGGRRSDNEDGLPVPEPSVIVDHLEA